MDEKAVCLGCIELKNITKRFSNRKAIDSLHLSINESAFIVLLGASGCGKSTLLRLIAGLESPDIGEVLLQGQVATRVQPHKRNCSLSFQNGVCYDHWTVRKNIEEAAKGTDVKVVSDVLDTLGLNDCMHQYPAELSGGEKQRVSLARTLVSPKGIYLLDEPLAQLNPKMRYHARKLIRRVHDQNATTTVFVTHDLAEALFLADIVVVMDQGKIVSQGSPRECFDPPQNEHCASLLGSYDLLPSNQVLPLPHHWKILAIGHETTKPMQETLQSDGIVLQGTIENCRWLGTYWELRVRPVLNPDVGANHQIDRTISVHVPDGPSVSRELAKQLRAVEAKRLETESNSSREMVWISAMVRSGVERP
ncbi:MAG: ABC transporter ATP-binding protein [Pirellula sp.]